MQSLRFKTLIVAGAAALVLGGAALGVASAQQTPTPTPGTQGQTTPQQTRFQQFIQSLAQKLGLPADRVEQAYNEARQEVAPFKGGREGWMGLGEHGFGGELSVAAQALNITPQQLRQELAGKSLADVARARNVDPNVVANALKADVNSRIDQAVSNGRLAADRAATLKQQASQQIDQLMTRQIPAAGAGSGCHDQAPGTSSSSSSSTRFSPGTRPAATTRS